MNEGRRLHVIVGMVYVLFRPLDVSLQDILPLDVFPQTH